MSFFKRLWNRFNEYALEQLSLNATPIDRFKYLLAAIDYSKFNSLNIYKYNSERVNAFQQDIEQVNRSLVLINSFIDRKENLLPLLDQFSDYSLHFNEFFTDKDNNLILISDEVQTSLEQLATLYAFMSSPIAQNEDYSKVYIRNLLEMNFSYFIDYLESLYKVQKLIQ